VENKTIARVFPRRTKQSPTDGLAFFGPPPMLFRDIDAVHVSVTFSWDMERAEWLADQWEHIAPVQMGGPAFLDKPGGDFIPGMYLKKGMVITSRGCPNNCWFCTVWKRDGDIQELSITEGWNVQDDNLLACSDNHIKNVFTMLKKQRHGIEFTGGLEAKRLKKWHVLALVDLKPKQIFFAYDTPDDYEPLVEAGKLLFQRGAFSKTSHTIRCYVLIGYPRDTMGAAEKRLIDVCKLGISPMAMLYRDQKGKRDRSWKQFQRTWANPTILFSKAKKIISSK
jgi:hypothetical protein